LQVVQSNLVRMKGTPRRVGEGDGPIAGMCELAVRHKKQRHVLDAKFELVDAGGKATLIEIAGADVLGTEEKRAKYSDVANEPGVDKIGMRPEPNIDVVLRTAWIREGAPIEVLAVFEDNAMRAIAAGTPEAVEAWTSDQMKEAERRAVKPQKTKLPWDVVIPLALVIVTIILAEISVAFGGAHFTFMAPSIAITIAAAASGLLWDQVKLPKFDEREKKRTGLFATLAILAGIAINLTPEGPLGWTIQGALVLAVAVFGLVREHRAVSLIRKLVQPPDKPEPGKAGVFVGKVGDATPEQFFSQLIAVGAIHTIRKSMQKNPMRKQVVDTERKGFDSTFQLQLPKQELEVDPKNATWSSELRNKRETWSVFLPINAAIVAYGTPEKQGGKLVLKAGGPDSLVFYGAPGDDDPQALLRRKLALHQVTYGSLFMVVALAAAIAIHGFIVGA
jgi:hypothetical protein